MPSYPWQRQVCWLEIDHTESDRHAESDFPFLANRIDAIEPSWDCEVNLSYFPFLQDHVVMGRILFPGSGFIEAGLELNHALFAGKPCVLQSIKFHQFLDYDRSLLKKIRVTFSAASNQLSVWSTEITSKTNWCKHFTATLVTQITPNDQPVRISELIERKDEISSNTLYERLSAMNLNYGPSFKCVKRAWIIDDKIILAKLEYPLSHQENFQYLMHPGMLDAVFHSLVASEKADLSAPYVPSHIASINYYGPFQEEIWVYSEITDKTEKSITENIKIFNNKGYILCEIKGFCCAKINADQEEKIGPWFVKALYQPVWEKRIIASKHVIINRDTMHLIFAQSENSLVKNLLGEFDIQEVPYRSLYYYDNIENEKFIAELSSLPTQLPITFVCPQFSIDIAQATLIIKEVMLR